ncbi:hypothetical protein ILYODFUR_014251 [Ilyodon furcidens]|uniref:Uncharacterized protein n=1 Tax=Ilyodon furcidens TaxID=33524 RepID=A0ABV0TUJ1_9TELE
MPHPAPPPHSAPQRQGKGLVQHHLRPLAQQGRPHQAPHPQQDPRPHSMTGQTHPPGIRGQCPPPCPHNAPVCHKKNKKNKNHYIPATAMTAHGETLSSSAPPSPPSRSKCRRPHIPEVDTTPPPHRL